MNLLLDLTLRGSIAALVVMALDRSLAGKVSGSSRRWWWWFVPAGFLVPLRIPIPVLQRLSAVVTHNMALPVLPTHVAALAKPVTSNAVAIVWIWASGILFYVAVLGIQTWRASRRWSAERLSTDHELLELLEDCKALSGVKVPVGLVVSNSVPSPAILGWLRPRILLPSALAASASRDELRSILLHELAHFRGCDVPFNWVFTAARAVHWFNPLIHLAASVWTRFREETADEVALRWMGLEHRQVYGNALMGALRHAQDLSMPFGSMAIVESAQRLRRRIYLISRCQRKPSFVALTGAISLLLAAVTFSTPVAAAGGASTPSTTVAIARMHSWLEEIDAGKYRKSWTEASSFFQSRVTADGWASALDSARSPLGKCLRRQQVSSLVQKNLITPGGKVPGKFLVVQFESSFENMKYVVETVSFFQEADGTWKAAGYLIYPR